ncbi:MAG: hypothetical protein JO127_03685 [Caulobacteraceae bacterium]|nr:hypothetical protein [Caulobacteraceae bacterium]
MTTADRASVDAKSLPPPGIRWTFHGTALVENYHTAVEWLGRFIGLVPLESSDAGPPINRFGGCCTFGDTMLELMQSNDPNSSIGRWLAKSGPSFYNLAIQVADLVAAAEWLAKHEVGIVVPPENHFTFTRPSTSCGLHLEWADTHNPEWDPHFGHQPQPGPPPLIEAPRVAWWGALVEDPKASVERLAAIFGVRPSFVRLDAPDDQAVASLPLPDGFFNLYRLPADAETERRLWGSSAGRPRLHAAALRVRDLPGAARVFAREGVGVLRGDAASGEIVTSPKDTVGLTLAWTDRDPPDDPRGPLA